MAVSGRSGPHIADVEDEKDRVDDAGLDPETVIVTQDGINEEEGRVGEPDIAGVALGANIQPFHRSVWSLAHI
jgi:hypothetical protein